MQNKIVFCSDLEPEIQECLEEFAESKVVPEKFRLLQDKSAQGFIYRLDELPYVIKIYKNNGIGSPDHHVLIHITDSPYVPKVYAYQEDHFVVMEFIEGIYITQYVERFHTLPDGFLSSLEKAFYDIAKQGLFALSDFKEDTCIVDPVTGRFKVIDYGVGDRLDEMPEEIILDMALKRYKGFVEMLYDWVKDYPIARMECSNVLLAK